MSNVHHNPHFYDNVQYLKVSGCLLLLGALNPQGDENNSSAVVCACQHSCRKHYQSWIYTNIFNLPMKIQVALQTRSSISNLQPVGDEEEPSTPPTWVCLGLEACQEYRGE